LILPDQKLPCPCKWEDQAVWVWDAVLVDHHHPTDTVAAAAVIEVEAFVAGRHPPDPMAWDVEVEMIATVVAAAIEVDLVDLLHRAIGIEAAAVVDTTGVEVEVTGNDTDLQVLIDDMEETKTAVGVDTNIHYNLSWMYISFLSIFTTRSSCLAQEY
jgi:hypothetical protein